MMKTKQVLVRDLNNNDLILFEGARYYYIDGNEEQGTALFQREDGKDREIFSMHDKVSQIFFAERGFEEVIEECKNCLTYDTVLPTRKTARSAGYDFHNKSSIVFNSGEVITVWTDVKAFMLPDERLEVHIRSSLSNAGFRLINGEGVIDSDYYSNEKNDGNIGVMLQYIGPGQYTLEAGERIAQGIFSKFLTTYNDTTNGTRVGGIGSTGR